MIEIVDLIDSYATEPLIQFSEDLGFDQSLESLMNTLQSINEDCSILSKQED